MSKIGQKPIQVPASVQVEINEGLVTVRGSKGEVKYELPRFITVTKDGESLLVTRKDDSKKQKAHHGLYRSLIANAVVGVDKGWSKRLEIVGTGFNAKMQGAAVAFKIGYSHPVVFNAVPGVTFATEGNNIVIVSGADKQLVGQVAYLMKLIRKPDIYKGKGIRYEGEKVRIKPGKKAKA
jgi:large subunit ribosomal protein L6